MPIAAIATRRVALVGFGPGRCRRRTAQTFQNKKLWLAMKGRRTPGGEPRGESHPHGEKRTALVSANPGSRARQR